MITLSQFQTMATVNPFISNGKSQAIGIPTAAQSQGGIRSGSGTIFGSSASYGVSNGSVSQSSAVSVASSPTVSPSSTSPTIDLPVKATWKGLINPLDWSEVNSPGRAIGKTVFTVAEVGGAILGGAEVYEAIRGGSVIASTTADLTSNTGAVMVGGSRIMPYVIVGGIGAVIASIFSGGKQTATITPTQTTTPTQTPTQTITPTVNTPTTINPTIYIPGNGNTTYQDTYSYVANTTTQTTDSYQINTQNTTSSQTTTTSQDQGSSMLIPALIVGAILLFLKSKR